MDFLRSFTSRRSDTGAESEVVVAMPVAVEQAVGAPMTLETASMHSAYAAGVSTTTLVGLKLRSASTADDSRNALDVVICLDVSGSMQGDKLRLCKLTIKRLLRELTASDSVGVVVFGNEARVVVPCARADDAFKAEAARRVAAIGTEGCTNLSGGLFEAIEAESRLVSAGRANGVRCVLLLTDGQANRGLSEPDKLLKTLRGVMDDARAKDTSLYCFGYRGGVFFLLFLTRES